MTIKSTILDSMATDMVNDIFQPIGKTQSRGPGGQKRASMYSYRSLTVFEKFKKGCPFTDLVEIAPYEGDAFEYYCEYLPESVIWH